MHIIVGMFVSVAWFFRAQEVSVEVFADEAGAAPARVHRASSLLTPHEAQYPEEQKELSSKGSMLASCQPPWREIKGTYVGLMKCGQIFQNFYQSQYQIGFGLFQSIDVMCGIISRCFIFQVQSTPNLDPGFSVKPTSCIAASFFMVGPNRPVWNNWTDVYYTSIRFWLVGRKSIYRGIISRIAF